MCGSCLAIGGRRSPQPPHSEQLIAGAEQNHIRERGLSEGTLGEPLLNFKASSVSIAAWHRSSFAANDGVHLQGYLIGKARCAIFGVKLAARATRQPNRILRTPDWLQGYCLGDGGWAEGGVSKKNTR
jgi:hypothetical protein